MKRFTHDLSIIYTPFYYGLAFLTLLCISVLVTLTMQLATVFAQSANCSTDYYINETLPTGGRWEMCWEHRTLEGIVYYDIYYTSPDGVRRKVLGQAGLAQIHVPYDDNGARYHDVTDYGLGGTNLENLTTADCPMGNLLVYSGKNVLCKQIQSQGYSYKYYGEQLHGYLLTLFSVSHVGAYNYIAAWNFYDNGTIEPMMGATGKLQRFGTDPQYGWPLGNQRIGIAHTHNYYWRLDFDLGGTPTDDVIEEFEFPETGTANRTLSKTQFNTEAARSSNPLTMRSWRIRDNTINNADGHAISYQLEPSDVGHRFVGPSYEPWTNNDFYATVYHSCEKFISHNPTANNCGDNVTTFVNGQSLAGADPVIWYGVTFHHLPRDEDEPHMDAHWNGFQLIPRDWSAQNTLGVTATPVAPTPTPVPTNTPAPVVCRTYTSSNVPIALPNGTANIQSVLNVPDSGAISDVNLNLNIPHTWVGDLSVTLVHGASVAVMERPGAPASTYGCRYDNVVAKLDDQAANAVENQCATTIPAINGVFKPNNPLSAFNGRNSNGTWTLQVNDFYPSSDAGTLNSWSLELCTTGAAGMAAAHENVGPEVTDTEAAIALPISTVVELTGVDTSPDRPEVVHRLFMPLITR